VQSREIRLFETLLDFSFEEVPLQLQKKLIDLHRDDAMKGKFMKDFLLISISAFRLSHFQN
jgi:hypothetical protein